MLDYGIPSNGIPNNVDTQDSIGKDSIGKDSIESKSRAFTPPSLDEVTSYVNERHSSVDPQRFIDFYSSKGWMVGKNKMKDWKAAVRTWEQRDKDKKAHDYDERAYSQSDYDDLIAKRLKGD